MPAAGDRPERRLRDLGLTLPDSPTPLGRYVPLTRAGPLVFVSGMLPLVDGAPRFIGVLGDSLTLDDGLAAARLATTNALATLRRHLGDLDRVEAVVRLAVYLRTTAEFAEHARIADAASGLIAHLWDRGHARMVFGVSSLPAGVCVEIELIAAFHEAHDPT
jgi:enamine deaminase RidA (YjgF/YER057c/UK114 family)